MQKREVYPDIIKGVAIITVVLGHNIQFGSGGAYYTEELYYSNWVYKMIYSFHMPLFMLVSGYFFARTINNMSYSAKIFITRITKLLVPILVWSLLPFSIKIMKAIWASQTIGANDFVVWYLNVIVSNLWFLWAVLLCSLIVLYIHVKLDDNIWAYIIICLASMFIPDALNSHYYKYMFPYFVVGYLWNYRSDISHKFLNRIDDKKWVFMLGIVISYGILYAFFNDRSYIYTTKVSIYGEFGLLQIGIDLYRWCIGFIGSALILYFFHILLGNKRVALSYPMKVLTTLGSNSLGIYLINDVMNKYVTMRITNSLNFNYGVVFIETFLMLLICVGVTVFLQKWKLTRKLLLGSR
jgi:fucose 4-O-acetylase-like acetyltransferase